MKAKSAIWLVAVSAATIAAAQPHTGDAWPGVSAAEVLKLSPAGGAVDGTTVLLPPASGLLRGWSGNSPGFDDVETDDFESDTFPLADDAVIWLDVVALDPALRTYTPGFQVIPAGGTTFLGTGSGDVHVHLIWHINSQAADFDPLRTYWRGTFRLRDSGATAYEPSETFTFYFTNTLCTPGDVSGDQVVNNFDIDPFVAVLLDPTSATPEARCAADANRDGAVDNFDIDAFVGLVVAG